jgi:hypothetical protein
MERSKTSYLRSFAIALLCWGVVAAVLGVQLYVYDRSQKNYLPLFHYVIWPALTFVPFALFTPLVLAFGRRYPFTREHWMVRLLQYVAATIVLTFGQAAIQGFGGWLYTHEMPLGPFILHTLRKNPVGNVQLCIVLFGIAAYARLRDEAKSRQVREAQLESRVASAELEMLRIQLHPHFLFNTLQAATVLLHEDPHAAEDVLLRLSELLRVALDEMRNQEVTLEQELAFLDLYVGIQKQRFKDRLQIHVHADADTLRLKVPSLILQPLVENAVHHGVGKHKGIDTIEVLAQTAGIFTELEVRNYSSSLDENEDNSGHGVGLRNTRARLEQMYGDEGSLELRSILPKGVSAFVRFPSTSRGRLLETTTL